MSYSTANSVLPAAQCSVLLYEHKVPRRAHQPITLKLGSDVQIKADHIQRYCFSNDTAMLEDIAAVLSAVRIADRICNRQHGKGWSRDLAVELPVFRIDRWRSLAVVDALTDALQYLTGDRWNFTFAKKRSSASSVGQAHLIELPTQQRVFMPYSNGLDSFALANDVQRMIPAPELVLVNVRAAQTLKTWKDICRKNDKGLPTVQVAVYFKEPHRTEPTFRSRPFIYDLLAGYGAAIAQPARVLIPENGQGSLGGSLVPLGNEAPHRSCHPGFTSRLAVLLEALTGTQVSFDHPALFQTKGQVLQKLALTNPSTESWLAGHRSCSYDARHSSQDNTIMHCGICGNCLLRRVGLLWAGIHDSTLYRARNLTARSFEGTFDGQVPRTVNANRDVALNGIRAMQRLADLANKPDSIRVTTEVVGLAVALGEPINEVRSKMEQFLRQHQTEWSRFLKECGPHSWVADIAAN
jgi:hypothetical protein